MLVLNINLLFFLKPQIFPKFARPQFVFSANLFRIFI